MIFAWTSDKDEHQYWLEAPDLTTARRKALGIRVHLRFTEDFPPTDDLATYIEQECDEFAAHDRVVLVRECGPTFLQPPPVEPHVGWETFPLPGEPQ